MHKHLYCFCQLLINYNITMNQSYYNKDKHVQNDIASLLSHTDMKAMSHRVSLCFYCSFPTYCSMVHLEQERPPPS